MNHKGFTLIELLVVIAIIGVLASIVMVSLRVARSKALDVRVKAQLSSLQTAAEIYNSMYENYGTNPVLNSDDCAGMNTLFTDPAVAPLVTVVNYPSGTTLMCNSTANGTAYAVGASLSSGAWCVDSTGQFLYSASLLASGETTCA